MSSSAVRLAPPPPAAQKPPSPPAPLPMRSNAFPPPPPRLELLAEDAARNWSSPKGSAVEPAFSNCTGSPVGRPPPPPALRSTPSKSVCGLKREVSPSLASAASAPAALYSPSPPPPPALGR